MAEITLDIENKAKPTGRWELYGACVSLLKKVRNKSCVKQE